MADNKNKSTNKNNNSKPNISAADAEVLNQELQRATSTAAEANKGESADVEPARGIPHIIDSDHA